MRDELRTLPSLSGPFRNFDLDRFPDDPHVLFALWLRQAIDARIREPHAMTLSTVDENGVPDARVLILKDLDARGWHLQRPTADRKVVSCNGTRMSLSRFTGLGSAGRCASAGWR